MADVDVTKLMPLLVSMRAMCDSLLLEIADGERKHAQTKRSGKGLGLLPKEDDEKQEAKRHVHRLMPGMGSTGICLDCGMEVPREDVDDG